MIPQTPLFLPQVSFCHHYIASYSTPVKYEGDYAKFASNMNNPKHFQASINFIGSKLISSFYAVRGQDIKVYGMTKAINDHYKIAETRHISFSGDHVNVNYNKLSPGGDTESRGIQIVSSTAAGAYHEALATQCEKFYKSRKYLHKYTELGMDEMEFAEAISNHVDLVAEYKQYEENDYDDMLESEESEENDDY